jgi:hypothetical protein
MPKFDERFARQYRYELPPGFPLASPNSGIGHHLSGLNKYAQARTSRVGRCCIDIHSFRFHCAYEFNTLTLAHLFNSLVRVSRRVVYTCHSRQLTASRFASLLHWKNSFIETSSKSVEQLRSDVELLISHQRSKPSQPTSLGSRTVASPLAISGILTLLSKSFSTFPHGTCLLSISRQYLAVDGGYHPICALLPKSVTH